MTEPANIDRAIEALFNQFSVLVEAGSTGEVPGDRSTWRLTTTFVGKQIEAMRMLANRPDLPYRGDPSKLVQHATFVWCYVLTAVLATKDPNAAWLEQRLRWELDMRLDAERKALVAEFDQYLRLKSEELATHPNPAGLVEEIMRRAVNAPPEVRDRCCSLVADSPHIRRVINSLPEGDRRSRLVEWMESYL